MTNGRILEFRCRTAKPDRPYGFCNRLLFAGRLDAGTKIRIRCPACGTMHQFEAPSNGAVARSAEAKPMA